MIKKKHLINEYFHFNSANSNPASSKFLIIRTEILRKTNDMSLCKEKNIVLKLKLFFIIIFIIHSYCITL